MVEIQLTQNKYTLIDDEDCDYLNQYNWHVRKSKNTYYAVRTDNKLKKMIHMHRVIMNPQDKLQVDHINRNGLDNRKENLRICTQSQNLGNSRIFKNNTSGIKGVTWHKTGKKWLAQIQINSRRKYLGLFSDKLEAKNAYNKAAKQYFGEFYSDGIRKSVI